VLLDVVLIVLAYWSCDAIKFEPFVGQSGVEALSPDSAVLVVVRLAASVLWRLSRHLAVHQHGRSDGVREGRGGRIADQ